MSTFVDLGVTCPTCGVETERSVATSLNATRAPEYREAVLDGSFQRFACPRCGTETAPLLPFVYLDFGRRHYIGVFPLADESRWWDLEHEPADSYERNLGAQAPPPARALNGGFAVRTVFGLSALREKIVTFDAGIDDAVLETLKLRLMAAVEGLTLTLQGRPRLVGVVGDDLVFLVPSTAAGEPARLELPRSDYDAVAGDRELREGFVAHLTAGPYRDAGRLLHPAPALAPSD